MISVENVHKRAGAAHILKGVSFAVAAQTVLGVIGASGSGKTTLLRCLNGLERVDAGAIGCGEVRLEASLGPAEYARRVKELRKQTGTVFQHLHLFPHLSALGNVTEAPIHVRGVARRAAETEALRLLEAVGLGHAARRYPDSLSGGEQQRVAIARALMMRPRVLLFDEPTSALDPRRTAQTRELLRGFVAEGQTMIVVSHSVSFLDGLADALLYLEAGEVVEHGPVRLVLDSPREERTRDFLRQAT